MKVIEMPTPKSGEELWGIYFTDREYARVMGDPLRAVIAAPTKIAAEEAATRLGLTDAWAHPLTAEQTKSIRESAKRPPEQPRITMQPTTAELRTAIEVLKVLDQRLNDQAAHSVRQLPNTELGDQYHARSGRRPSAFAGPPAAANVAAQILRGNRIGGRISIARKIMSTPDQPTPPDFDEDFLQAIAKWKEQFKIKDDDPILLLLDLFRIHQNHWDEIRHRQMPSLDEFEKDIAALTEATKILKERALKEIQAVELPTAIYSVIAAVIAGFLIGKFL